MVLLPTAMTSRQAFLDSHPSINASMDDFEAREFSPTVPDMPSQHSGFRSNNASEYSETSRRSYSPPAWRKAGSGWFKHQSLSPNRSGYNSKEPSPQYHSMDEDGDFRTYRSASKIPLPESPTKGRSPTCSPEPMTGPGADDEDEGGGDTTLTNEQFAMGHETPRQKPRSDNCKSRHVVSIAPCRAWNTNFQHRHSFQQLNSSAAEDGRH